jgi:hypothetical protein
MGLTPGATSNVLHILPVTQETKYIWSRGGDLHLFFFFLDIHNLPFVGVGLTPGATSNVLHILPVTQGTRIYLV